VEEYGCTFKDEGGRCMKIAAEDSSYCPYHQLIHEDLAKEPRRRAEKRRRDRGYKAQQAEALKNSPLAAVNPDFNHDGERISGQANRRKR
jgi:hypothetical protein